MRIISADCFIYSLPFVSPLILGGVKVVAREGLLLRLVDDNGGVGWGEAAPLPGFSKESLSEARGQCIRLAQELSQTEIDIAAFFNDNESISLANNLLCSSVQFALESALAELWSSFTGKPIAELFGVSSRDSVLVNGLLAGDDETILHGAVKIAEQKFQAVKMKIGDRTPEKACELFGRVTNTMPSSTALRLDINRQWNLSDAMRFDSLVSNGDYLRMIEYIEEPVGNSDDLKVFISESNLPIALDETILDISPKRLSEYSGATAIILKPTLLGGLRRTHEFSLAAKSLEMKVVLSSSFESDMAVAILARFAVVVCDTETACGFDTLKWFKSSLLTTPPVIIDGGIKLDNKQIREMAVNKQMIRKITNA